MRSRNALPHLTIPAPTEYDRPSLGLGVMCKALTVPLSACIFFLSLPSNCFGQTSSTTQSNSGSTKLFAVTATSNFSVNASASGSPGVLAKSEATAVLLPESSLNTAVNCANTNCSANFSQSPNTSALTVSGSSSQQNLYIDPKSVFTTLVDTSGATQTSNQNTGSASAGFTASTSLTATEQQSTFTNVYINTF